MTIQHQIQNHYEGFRNAFGTVEMPAWLTGVWTRLAITLAVVVFGVLYLFQTGNTAVAGYEIHDLERQAADLSDEIKNLEIQVADYSSLSYIKTRLPELNLVSVASFKNLSSAPSAAVARR